MTSLDRSGRVALICAALFAVAGLVALILRSNAGASGGSPTERREALAPPGAIAQRLVCSFSNDDASAAYVQGADGGASFVVGDRTYWLFGDTLFLAASGKQIEANTIAWSTGARPGGCPALTYHTSGSIAVPFLPKDGSLTVWPVGAWPADDHTLDVYTAYVYGSGPYAYWIGEVGVTRLDTQTMQQTVVGRRLWDAQSGFASQVVGATVIEEQKDGRLCVVLETLSGDELLARAPPGSIAEAAAYEYWDGAGWSPNPAQAQPLWPQAKPSDPVQRLAAFTNGVSVAYNAHLKQYVAVQNVGFDKIGARVADRLEGPWSAPTIWIDCSAIAKPDVPTCYSPYQHPELASADGRTLFLTFTRKSSYDVVAYEVTLGGATEPARSGDAPNAAGGAGTTKRGG